MKPTFEEWLAAYYRERDQINPEETPYAPWVIERMRRAYAAGQASQPLMAQGKS